MAYQTPIYLFLFLPLAILCYAVCPQKHRWKVLLIFSYLFFYSVSRKLLVYLIGTTVLTHYIGLWLELLRAECKGAVKGLDHDMKKQVKEQYTRKERGVLLCGVIILLAVLAYLKYFNFFAISLSQLSLKKGWGFQISARNIAVPLGISFYTLQALGYMIDVYRGTIPAEKNLGKLGLFLGFFPQIMEGPICRYGETAQALFAGAPVTGENLRFGIQRILWGLFKKFVIADRLNILVKTVFDAPDTYGGVVVIAAAISYTVQLYMEFSGAIDIVIGSAQIFGVKMPENFRQPFFSKNASEFWRRWHISLSTWFREYLYIPLGGNRKGKAKTYRNKLIVFFCTGLWHGANWTFIVWGLWHGFFIVAEDAVKKMFRIEKHGKGGRNPVRAVLKHLYTLLVVLIGFVIFRADNMEQAASMIRAMFSGISVSAQTGLLLAQCFTQLTLFAMGIGILSSTPILPMVCHKAERQTGSVRTCLRVINYAAVLVLLLVDILHLSAASYVPFIYFQF